MERDQSGSGSPGDGEPGLPDAASAWIPVGKLKGYLLSETHRTGRSKAAFLAGLGYGQANRSELERDLLILARTRRVVREVATRHGTKYVIDGDLYGTLQEARRVRTVWIVEPDGRGPRLVTAYPVGREPAPQGGDDERT
jgi:hypothetical protein